MKIYVCYWDEQGPVKIGISSNPRNRLNSLQTACPYKLKIESFLCDDDYPAAQKEKDVHAALEWDRLSGEWFNISLSEAIFEIKNAHPPKPMPIYDMDFSAVLYNFAMNQAETLEIQKIYHCAEYKNADS